MKWAGIFLYLKKNYIYKSRNNMMQHGDQIKDCFIIEFVCGINFIPLNTRLFFML